MIRDYKLWKQKVISQAISAHQESLPKVNQLGDAQIMALYDKILGVLTGPHTIRLRRDPGLFDALRLRKAQRAFSSALYHHQKIADLNK
ncbi:hypothetical protein QO021_29560 (plasmid) [Pseudomonas amygdali pv. lachrymans]|uniref:hypothetical protein n=1 Tax=Pseudomonas amygdali TaxID=47877 RepID=UPI0006B9154E|nr:hypothetical protein [Pseudomonas amygdali]RMM39029.1 hypothetical protein ALQ79_200389 [Pseudomonas amygdali pv. lachrymans]WIO61238.1 hypothetical protein QO021_29560 [Pseudomonas amygdali pv. lachrymans]